MTRAFRRRLPDPQDREIAIRTERRDTEAAIKQEGRELREAAMQQRPPHDEHTAQRQIRKIQDALEGTTTRDRRHALIHRLSTLRPEYKIPFRSRRPEAA